MYDDDDDSIDWGSTFRLQTGWQPFTSIDGTVVDPDVVTFGFCLPGSTTNQVFTWTNGAVPPDPTYNVERKVITITAVTPGNPSVGNALYTSSTNHNYYIGETVTLAGITPVGYSGTFIVVSVPTLTTFSVANATTGVAVLTAATSTETGAFYMDVNTTLYMPTYIQGPWNCWIQGAPGTSGLDVSKTQVRTNKVVFVNGPDC